MEALKAIEQFRPNILISDLGMPQISGYELIKRVRQLPATQGGNVKAIAITGYASAQDRQKSFAMGFDCHLDKPIDINTLLKMVNI